MYAVEVADFGEKGRGVIGTQAILMGDLIERCPVIIVPSAQRDLLKQTVLSEYYFNWPFIWSDQGGPAVAIVLGYGSLYNHAYDPNVRIELNPITQSADVYAVRDIVKGEELTHNYGGRPQSEASVGFKVR
ncbi:SET domain-containing protein [Myxococcota bacterium]|nr:SET domain-containing protein [Myxococcota bacterium]MBU1429166.1 SET domain-containing protein [Myxococcota bacterium]MBU1896364.1 SET domain-containing protein [Myxococcota bacterium]